MPKQSYIVLPPQEMPIQGSLLKMCPPSYIIACIPVQSLCVNMNGTLVILLLRLVRYSRVCYTLRNGKRVKCPVFVFRVFDEMVCSRASSIALASAVNIEECFDNRHVWTTESVTAAAATLSSSLAPSVKMEE